MSTSVTYNGVSYTVPAVGESAWGTNVSTYLIALATGSLTKAGGAFTLAGEVNFGATYGLKTAYIKSQTGTAAAAGVLRLGNNGDAVSWRNAANNADLALLVNASDKLTFNGTAVALASGNYINALTGDVTATGPSGGGSAVATLAATTNSTLVTLSALTTANALTSATSLATLAALTTVGTIGTGTWAATNIAANHGGTGVANNAANTLTFVGNFGLTLTLSNTTSVTLPTAGTLATLAGSETFTNKTLTSPTLTAPVLGTPASGNLANCTFPTLNQNTSGTAAGLSATLAIASGGTNVTSVTTAPAATAWAGWDANKNLSANNYIEAYATTATAAATTTLVVGSAFLQYFTGSTTQTVVLPVTSTLVLGQQYQVVNSSSGVVTVQSSGANTVQAMAANSVATFTCILTSGTTAASWSVTYQTASAGGGSVTSVAFTGPGGIFGISGSPITTSGTLTQTVTGTSGGVPYFSSASTLSTSAALTANGVVLGGGAGTAPTATAAGTNGQLLVGVTSGAPAFGSTVSAATTFSGGVVFNGGGTNLNWYEEGTWTPTIGWGTQGTGSAASAAGKFTRIGRVVYFTAYVSITVGNASGNISWGGLPYASGASAQRAMCTGYMQNLNVSVTKIESFEPSVEPNGTTGLFLLAGNGGTVGQVQASNLSAGAGDCYWSGFYFTS